MFLGLQGHFVKMLICFTSCTISPLCRLVFYSKCVCVWTRLTSLHLKSRFFSGLVPHYTLMYNFIKNVPRLPYFFLLSSIFDSKNSASFPSSLRKSWMALACSGTFQCYSQVRQFYWIVLSTAKCVNLKCCLFYTAHCQTRALCKCKVGWK